MTKIVLWKLLYLILVVFSVATLTFLLTRTLPGNPYELMWNEGNYIGHFDAPKKYSLSLVYEYFLYIKRIVTLDFGESIYLKKDVLNLILDKFSNTFSLAVLSIIISILISFPAGAIAALKPKSKLSSLFNVMSFAGVAMPTFVIGPILIILFSYFLRVLPFSGNSTYLHYILPSLTLGLGMSAFLYRIVKSSLEEVLSKDYIRTARSKGISEYSVLVKHVFPNAAIPIIAVLGMQLGHLLTGTIVTETIFDWPGIGTLFYRGILGRDYPIIEGVILFFAAIYVLINFGAEILYAFFNPKLRK